MSIVVFLILCSLATFVLAIFTFVQIWPLRRLPAIRWLLGLTAVFFVASFSTVMVLIAPHFGEKVFFFYLRTSAYVFLAPFWLLFLAEVFERWRWLHDRWVAAFLIVPSVANLLLAVLPGTRDKVHNALAPLTYGEMHVVGFEFGPWYWPFFYWAMLLMLLSYVMSAFTFWSEKGFYRRQVLILNLGLAAALLNFVFPFWLAGPESVKAIQGPTLSVLFTQIGILYAVTRHRLLSLVPLAAVRIFRKFPDPVLVLDDRARVMGASDRAVSLFSLPQSFLGKRIGSLLPALKLEPGEQAIAGAQHFHLVVESLGDSSGKVIFFRDIAAQKRVEKSLQEGLEFRARLLAFLSHDLTGSLENLAMLSRSLQAQLRGKELPEVELLAQSAQASQEFGGNIIAWLKSQVLELKVERRPFEWNTLLRETIEQLEPRFRVKGVKVSFGSDRAHLLGSGDSELLAAVFRNLLSNALRATPGGGQVSVALKVEGAQAQVSVRDEGPGIDPERLATILEASREFTLRGMPNSQGTGIGLMLVRFFVGLSRGSFQMSSKLGEGTRVSFSVPL